METKTFDVPTLVSVTSGVLLTMPFSKVTEAIEWILGHPVWTHELGSDALWQLMRAKLLEQHPDLDVDASKVDSENCQAFVDELTARLGQSREVVKGDEHRGAHCDHLTARWEDTAGEHKRWQCCHCGRIRDETTFRRL